MQAIGGNNKMEQRKSIEVEGLSMRAAIKKALELLAVTRDKVEVKVLSEEEKGLFGMKGIRQAKIRVTLKDDKHKK